MYIAIDIGASFTRVAGATSLESNNFYKKIKIPTDKELSAGILNIIKAIKSIDDNPVAIGIGFAGSFDESSRYVERSTNLPEWVGGGLVDRLEKEFDCSVYARNDAVAQSMAEFYYGDSVFSHFLYLVWGTGVGGCVIGDNKGNDIVTWKPGRAYLGEWENLFGGDNLERRFGKQASELNDGEWEIVLADFKIALEVLSEELDVHNFVLGGGVVEKQKDKIENVIKI